MSISPDLVAKVLGIAKPGGTTTFDLVSRIQAGVPVSSLDRLAGHVAPGDPGFKYEVVAKATLVRRRSVARARLSASESDRVVRLARIWAFATEVWGAEDEARAFLFRPHPMLSNQRPIDMVLESELGGRLVEDILGRLKYGSAA